MLKAVLEVLQHRHGLHHRPRLQLGPVDWSLADLCDRVLSSCEVFKFLKEAKSWEICLNAILKGPAPSLTSTSNGGSTCGSKSNRPCQFPYKHSDGTMRSECFKDQGVQKCYTRLEDDYTVRECRVRKNYPFLIHFTHGPKKIRSINRYGHISQIRSQCWPTLQGKPNSLANCGSTCPLAGYHTHSELIAELERLANQHTNDSETFSIGSSQRGEDLKGIRWVSNEERKRRGGCTEMEV